MLFTDFGLDTVYVICNNAFLCDCFMMSGIIRSNKMKLIFRFLIMKCQNKKIKFRALKEQDIGSTKNCTLSKMSKNQN